MKEGLGGISLITAMMADTALASHDVVRRRELDNQQCGAG